MGREDCCSLLVPKLIGQPLQSLTEPVSTGGTGRLNVQVPEEHGVQAQFACDLCCIYGVGEVLLVCKHE